MKKVCLIVIYNHNFERNIPIIKRIYAGRFSHVYQVMPFYRGKDPDVIGVYEASYQFNGYIAQAAPRFISDEFSHYVIVADDMVLNPSLNEANIVERLNLSSDDGFISSCMVLKDSHLFSWPQGRTGVMYENGTGNLCEWKHVMPTISEARKRFEDLGYDWRTGASRRLYSVLRCGLRAMRTNPWQLVLLPPLGKISRFVPLFCKGRDNLELDTDKLLYPTAWGYSDFVVVPCASMHDFCHYCGVFAAMRQFVEAAIPTSLILSCKSLKTLKDIGWKAENGVDDYRVRQQIEKESGFSYAGLIRHFPKDYAYVHPVKLSKWKDLP